MGNVNLVRPDGSLISVNEEDAGKLRAVGYKDESSSSQDTRGAAEGLHAYYTTGAQKVKTLGEGILSGATVSLSDYALTGLGADTAERADYNPGVRLGGEVVGALGSALLTGGESLAAQAAERTPAGLVTRLAAGGSEFAEAKGIGKVGQSIATGAIEGAGAGLQAELSNNALKGDPLTVESALAGMGWGAVWGGGIGGVLGAGASAIEGKVAARAAVKEAAALDGRAASLLEEKYSPLAGAMLDTGKTLTKAVNEAATHSATLETHAASIEGKASEELLAGTQSSRNYLNGAVDQGWAAEKEIRPYHTQAAKDLSKLQSAIKQGKLGEVPELIEAHQASMAELEERLSWHNREQVTELPTGSRAQPGFDNSLGRNEGKGMAWDNTEGRADFGELNKRYPAEAGTPEEGRRVVTSPRPVEPAVPLDKPGFEAIMDTHGQAALRAKQSAASFEELATLGSAGKILQNAPFDAAGFAKMAPGKAEKVFGAVEALLGSKAAELEGSRIGLQYAIDGLADHMGLAFEGSSTTQKLRDIYTHARSLKSVKATKAVEEAASGSLPWWKRYSAYKAGSMAARAGEEAVGGGIAGGLVGAGAFEAARNMALGVLGIKGAILGSIAKKAADWAPGVAKALRVGERLAPRLEPLSVRLDGRLDEEKNSKKLMERRAQEIREAATSVRDTLYKGVAPLNLHHPEFAAALHDTAVNQFMALYNKLPQDPGQAFSGLKTLWKPDPVETAKFERYYEAFHNPTQVLSDALDKGAITPEAAEFIAETNPTLFATFRTQMLERLAEPGVMEKLSYEDQVNMGLTIGVPLHSTMTARFIAPQQQMYVERAKAGDALPIPPQTGSSNGGRPAGPGATSAQKTY